MAKDDYFVIVYQVLAYLYRCLKDGEDLDPELLAPTSRLLNINERYWGYIIENLQNDGFIRGASLKFAMGHVLYECNLENCQITPKGIEYLCENSTIKKAYKFLKEVKSIVPFEL